MTPAEEFRKAFDAGDEQACTRLLESHPDLANSSASDKQPYIRSALHRESHGQSPGMSELFLKFGSTVDVLTAAALGDQEAVERIVIDKQEELHAMDPWRMQPIHWAAHCGHREVVGWLLDQGADVNAAADSWTPLHLAVEIGHEDVATLLLEHGADPEARLDDEHDSMTPMEMAKAWKLHKMVEFLGPYYG